MYKKKSLVKSFFTVFIQYLNAIIAILSFLLIFIVLLNSFNIHCYKSQYNLQYYNLFFVEVFQINYSSWWFIFLI